MADHLLSPEDIYAQAKIFGVNLTEEPYLIPLMKQAAITPLPPSYVATECNNEVDDVRNDATTQPATSGYFVQQICTLREQNEKRRATQQELQATEEDDEEVASAWMAFEEQADESKNGEIKTYYYNFLTQIRQEEPPLNTIDSHSQSGSTPIIGTHAFDQAASLHKQTAMKDVAALEILCFHSWWTELSLQGEKKKTLLHLYFSIPTKHFQLVLQDSPDVFTISHIIGSNGKLLTAWDLHVGARIPVLGRTTTLMQPSLLTRQWLELHETQFQRVRQELQDALGKFELKSHGRPHRAGRTECADPHRSQKGCSLRQVLTEIDTLKTRLATYRPDLVRRICAPIMGLYD